MAVPTLKLKLDPLTNSVIEDARTRRPSPSSSMGSNDASARTRLSRRDGSRSMADPTNPRRRRAAGPNPMDEENFPPRSPTRDAVEREMREPSNVRGSHEPVPRREPPAKEVEAKEEGDSAEDDAGREV